MIFSLTPLSVVSMPERFNPAENCYFLFDKADVPVNFLHSLVLSLVKHHLVLLEQISSMGIDGDDQRTKFLDSAYPECLRHAQVTPLRVLNLLDTGGGHDCTSPVSYTHLTLPTIA